MRAALDIHRDLLSRDVPHEVVRLRSTAAGADDLPRALDVEAASCVAVRCYVTDVGFVAVAVRAGVVPDPAAVLVALGAQSLRTATADEISSATDYAAGLVSPLGLPAEVPLLADAVLQTGSVLFCPAGEGGVALGIRSHDLLATTGAQVASLTCVPQPRQAPDSLGERGGNDRVIGLPPAAGPRRRFRRRTP